MKLKLYEYKPLTEADSFRLILLEPASSNTADLKCTLLHTTLSQCDRDIIDHYTALSYVWGNATQTGQIYVDGCRMVVTVTLEAALRDARDPHRVLRIWADALCINQADLDERSSQVGLMTQIYSVAHHTIIHLGALTAAAEIVLRAAPSNITTSPDRPIPKPRNDDAAANSRGDDLLRLPWFSRVWIFQELVKSRDPWVQCGTLRSRWTEFCNILLSPNQGFDNTRVTMLRAMNDSRGRSQGNLSSLLLARRGLGATDARDMIYAHMGMASDHNEIRDYIQVDYDRQSVSQVYESAARYLVTTLGPQKLFSQLEDRNLETAREGLASWAPDWSIPWTGTLPMFTIDAVSHRRIESKGHYVFIGEPLVLAHLGYEVDTISDISLVLPEGERLDPANREHYQQSVSALERMYHSGTGVWWSGDVNGQYRHVDLRGKEAEHERLCVEIVDEWQRILSQDVPALHQTPQSTEAVENHERFLEQFGQWHQKLARQQVIMVSSDSDQIQGLMYQYLLKKPIPSVLSGRSLAMTKAGRVAIVPKYARSGDILVYLAGSTVAVVLRRSSRPESPDAMQSIREAVRKNLEHAAGGKASPEGPILMVEEDLPVENHILIGEGYVNGEEGWKKKVDKEPEYKIFALR